MLEERGISTYLNLYSTILKLTSSGRLKVRGVGKIEFIPRNLIIFYPLIIFSNEDKVSELK